MFEIYPDTHEGDGKPGSFKLNGRKLVVNEVIDHWHEAQYEYLMLLADDGRIYFLMRREKITGNWKGFIHSKIPY